MTKFGLIAAIAISLTLSLLASAWAEDSTSQRRHYKKQTRAAPPPAFVIGEPNLPVQNALRWGYSQGYQNYPSGFGGLYGDGRYPGNTISNRNYPTWW